MNCPNCNKEMQDKSYPEYASNDYKTYLGTHEEYYCPKCKIGYEYGEWVIPRYFSFATQKQKAMVNFINNMLDTDYKPILKYPTMNFIRENVDKAREIKAEQRQLEIDWDYDGFEMADYYEEYF